MENEQADIPGGTGRETGGERALHEASDKIFPLPRNSVSFGSFRFLKHDLPDRER